MTHDYFEAEDLTQETFVSACKHFSNFQGDNIKPWLTTIAANKCRDYLKSAARRITTAEDSTLENLSQVPSPESEVLENSVEETLVHMCNELKEPYRSISYRYFCKQESLSEIAKETGENLKTLQTRIYRAKAMLKAKWKEEQT